MPRSKKRISRTRSSSVTTVAYSSRLSWQWILLYLAVGTVLYLLVYNMFFKGENKVYGSLESTGQITEEYRINPNFAAPLE